MKDWLLRLKVAEHEAAHAVAAQKCGLTVAWVQVNPGHDEGIDFSAAVKIPDETLDFERDVAAICVAMAAPSFLVSHENFPELWHYALLEADLAYQLGGRHGVEAAFISERAADIIAEYRPEITDLAVDLAEKGRVEFALA